MQHPSNSFPSHLVILLEGGLLVLGLLLATVVLPASGKPTLGRLLVKSGKLVRSRSALVWLATLIFAGFAGNALLTAALGPPEPGTDDAAAYLLTAETFAHGHLTNPAAPHRALVGEQVLATPVYIGKYPPGQAAFLLPGVLLGHPVVSLWLGSGLLAGALFWCLDGWLPRTWSLLGATLALLRLAVGGYWNHTYWGGTLAAIGGALLFGGLGRHFVRDRLRAPWSIGVGLAVLALTRPYEGLLCSIPVLAVVAATLFRQARARATNFTLRRWWRPLIPITLLVTSAFVFQAHFNKNTTGSPLRFAHQEYEAQRPVAGEFVWQRWLRSEHRFTWNDAQVPAGERRGWWRPAARLLLERAALSSNFLIGPALVLCIVLCLPRTLQSRRDRPLLAAVLFVVAGHALVYFYFPHYSSPLAAPLLILGIAGLRELTLRPPRYFRAARWLIAITVVVEVASFAFQLPALRDDENEFFVRQHRAAQRLESMGGEHLIFVNPQTSAVDNRRDLNAPVLWAGDLGDDELPSLLKLFPNRQLWRFDPYAETELQALDRAELLRHPRAAFDWQHDRTVAGGVSHQRK